MFRIILLFVFAAFIAGAVFTDKAAAEGHELKGLHKEAGLACFDCHGVDEPVKRAPTSACKSCHEDHKGAVRTYKNNGQEVTVNPHESHQGELRCTLCHSIHQPSKLYCNQDGCHAFDNEMNVK